MKRLVTISNKLLYHGTDFDSAISILSTMTIKGGGYSRKRMYSFSTDIETAEGFGDIVFCFNNFDNLIKVVYEKEWLDKHKDIANYVFCGGYDETQPGLPYMSLEEEYIGYGDLNFSISQLEKIVISDNVNDDEKETIIQELREINNNVNIM